MRRVEFLYYINVLSYIPLGSYLPSFSMISRIIQIITIICMLCWKYVNYDKKLFNKVNAYLFAIFFFNIISSFFHSEFELDVVLRMGLHLIYISSLFVLSSNINEKIFKNSIIILFFIFFIDFVLWIPQLQVDFSYLQFNLSEFVKIKRVKAELHNSGYTLSNIHCIPLLFLILLPFIKNKNRKIIISILVFIVMLFSFTFSAFFAMIVALMFNSFFKNKYVQYKYKHIIYVICLYLFFIILLYKFSPHDLYILTSGRSLLWEHALYLIKSNLFFGSSMNDFYGTIYYAFLNNPLSVFMEYNETAFDFTSGGCHNLFLNWLYNYGLISFIFYMAYISFIWNKIGEQHSIVILAPFVYILVRSTHESSGIIYPSSTLIEFIFDLYLFFYLSQRKRNEKVSYISRF